MLEGAPARGVPVFKRAGLPPAIAHAVRRARSADPDQRFADARDLADAIDERSRAPRSRWVRMAALAGAAAIVAVATAVSWATWHRRSVSRAPRMTRDSIALALYDRGRADLRTRSLTSIPEAFSNF